MSDKPSNVIPFAAPDQLPAVGSPKSYSATLRAALETPMVGIAHDGDFVLRPGQWQMPAVVTPAMRQEAVAACAALKGRSGPAPKDVIDRFVAHLANLCAGKDLPPESKLEGIASAILRGGYPLALFDDPDTLDRIARKFTWWPGWAEMAPVLDAERAALRVDYERLLLIAKGGKAPEPETSEPAPQATDEQKAAVRDMLAAAGVPLVEPEPVKTGSAAPGELKRVPGSERDQQEPADTREAVRRVMAETQGFRRVPKPWERATATTSTGSADDAR